MFNVVDSVGRLLPLSLASLGHDEPQLAKLQPGIHLLGYIHICVPAQLQGRHEEAVRLGTSWGSKVRSGECSPEARFRELQRAKQQSYFQLPHGLVSILALVPLVYLLGVGARHTRRSRAPASKNCS